MTSTEPIILTVSIVTEEQLPASVDSVGQITSSLVSVFSINGLLQSVALLGTEILPMVDVFAMIPTVTGT